ncbi:MAG: InlB B-repeat-containing protein, partial [Alphaproteobacteria bacterium]|nr:InlB B-repeat-containing protein [Alphaproteobacteria bacterium]
YSEDNEIQNVPSTSQSCTYDGSLTPPPVSYVPTRTGYTFKGWRVRPPVCSLSSLKPGIQGTAMSSVSENGQVNNYNGSNAATLGLVNNEWAVTFSYGVLLGKVKCSAKVGDNGGYMWSNASSNWKATESELDSAGPGNYCWCKPTKFIPDGGSMCYVSSTNWLFFEEEVDTCSSGCAYWCATQVFQTVSFRQRMYKNL